MRPSARCRFRLSRLRKSDPGRARKRVECQRKLLRNRLSDVDRVALQGLEFILVDIQNFALPSGAAPVEQGKVVGNAAGKGFERHDAFLDDIRLDRGFQPDTALRLARYPDIGGEPIDGNEVE